MSYQSAIVFFLITHSYVSQSRIGAKRGYVYQKCWSNTSPNYMELKRTYAFTMHLTHTLVARSFCFQWLGGDHPMHNADDRLTELHRRS